MTDIISRLEAAPEGSRELDIEIDRLVRPERYAQEKPAPADLPPGFGQDALSLAMHDAPHYTTSIDAVLALMPEGWRIAEMHDDPDDGCRVSLYCPYNRGLGWKYRSIARIPALALCIAILKANES